MPKIKAKPDSAKATKSKAAKKNTDSNVESRSVSAEIVDEEAERLDFQNPIQDSEVVPEAEEVFIPVAVNAIASSRSLTTTDALSKYLAEIRNYPVLSREEELTVAKKYFDHKDPAAAQTLVKSNLRFVVKIAAEYSKFGAKMIDLIQEGNVGLMHAVRDFNPYKGARLITYAVWWIRGHIQEYMMRQYSMVRIGTTQNQRKLFYQLQKEKDALDALGLEPTTALLSSRLGIPEDEIEAMSQRMNGRDVSLDKPFAGDSGSSLGDMQRNDDALPLDEQMAKNEQLQILQNKINELRPHLSEKENIILEERVLAYEPLTLQEIGDKYKITREAVRQTEARLMEKIKKLMLN